MKHIVVDLEMNKITPKSEARAICTQETIEIGAVMLDENYQEISAFRTYVRPEYNTRIEKVIQKLTGISYEMVEHAPTFAEAFRMFTHWCLGTGEDVKVYAWSDNDYNQISKELRLKQCELTPAEYLLVAEEWNDFQKEFDMHLGFERQVSLKMALDMAGICFAGREHDALDDARNTAELFQIFSDKNLFATTLQKIKELMEPTPIGFTLGELFDASLFEMVND